MFINTQLTQKFANANLEKLTEQISEDLLFNYQWNTSSTSNVISWDDVSPLSNIIRKPTDSIRNGKIEIREVSKSEYLLDFNFRITKSFYLAIWIIVAGPIMAFIYYQLRDSFTPPFPMIGVYTMAIGGPAMGLLLTVGNYFAFKLSMSSSLKKAIKRIVEKQNN